MVSVAKIRLDLRKSTRLFKGIICDDISEFESYMPSQAVGSLWAISGLHRASKLKVLAVGAPWLWTRGTEGLRNSRLRALRSLLAGPVHDNKKHAKGFAVWPAAPYQCPFYPLEPGDWTVPTHDERKGPRYCGVCRLHVRIPLSVGRLDRRADVNSQHLPEVRALLAYLRLDPLDAMAE